MSNPASFDHIEIQLVRVLLTVITERSVSRAAARLQRSQPAVSAQLRRLRALTGDELLVRAGQSMVPTERALSLIEPATRLLAEADRLFEPLLRDRPFDPSTATDRVRLAASDYLDPFFLPGLVGRLREHAPGLQIDLLPLSGDYDYRRRLAAGEADLVIGNWTERAGELHRGVLLRDEPACLLSEVHPAARAYDADPGSWTPDRYRQLDHVAPTPLHPGAIGIVDEGLRELGMDRRIGVRTSHFSLIPLMVARSLLVLTTGRLFCRRYAAVLPVRVLPCPVALPPLTYFQLWHQRTHQAPLHRWLRSEVKAAASTLEVSAA